MPLVDDALVLGHKDFKRFPNVMFLCKHAAQIVPLADKLMTAEGLGYALILDKLINVTGDSELCFRPLEPRLEIEIHLVWKKHQIFSKAAELFLFQL